MKMEADNITKKPLSKLVLCLVAIIQAGALLLAALIWQGLFSFPTLLIFAFLALGIVCFLYIIAFGYEKDKTGRPQQTKTQTQPIHEEFYKPKLETHRSKRRYPSNGTVILFEDSTGEPEDDELTMLLKNRNGLRMKWEIDGNPHRVERFDFPIVMGRDVSCPLVINAPGVSRRHAQLTYENGEYFISDIGSSNGTFLNGARIESSARINHGDEITLGNIDIKIDYISQ